MLIERCCEHCGHPFVYIKAASGRPRLYCTPKCRNDAKAGTVIRERRLRRLRRGRERTYSVPFICGYCSHCGDAFVGTRSQFKFNKEDQGPRKYCSKTCTARAQGWAGSEEERRQRKRERERGKKRARSPESRRQWYEKHKPEPKPRPCKGAYSKHIRRGYRLSIKASEKLLLIHAPKECVRCGGDVTHKGYLTCSPVCAKSHRRAIRSAEKAKRRAKESCGSEVDPIAVFMRDGWECQACGCSTPKHLRGTYEDDAPEVDHIVPLASGGPHSMDNVQCLCRVCNILKSSMPMMEFVKEFIGLGA